MFKKKKLEKIAVSVFRCSAVSWFSDAQLCNMFLYYQIMHLLGLFKTGGSLHEHACLFYEKCDVHSVSKMPSIITIYGADIEIKYSQVIQALSC